MKIVSPPVLLTDELFHFSFGRYLNRLFSDFSWVSKVKSDHFIFKDEQHCSKDCSHSLFRDISQIFFTSKGGIEFSTREIDFYLFDYVQRTHNPNQREIEGKSICKDSFTVLQTVSDTFSEVFNTADALEDIFSEHKISFAVLEKVSTKVLNKIKLVEELKNWFNCVLQAKMQFKSKREEIRETRKTVLEALNSVLVLICFVKILKNLRKTASLLRNELKNVSFTHFLKILDSSEFKSILEKMQFYTAEQPEVQLSFKDFSEIGFVLGSESHLDLLAKERIEPVDTDFTGIEVDLDTSLDLEELLLEEEKMQKQFLPEDSLKLQLVSQCEINLKTCFSSDSLLKSLLSWTNKGEVVSEIQEYKAIIAEIQTKRAEIDQSKLLTRLFSKRTDSFSKTRFYFQQR